MGDYCTEDVLVHIKMQNVCIVLYMETLHINYTLHVSIEYVSITQVLHIYYMLFKA